MKPLLLAAIVFAGFTVQAKDNFPALAASNIPADLRPGAHAVLRFDSTTIQVQEPDKIKFIQKYAVTILDEKGLGYARLLETYDNSVVINDLDALLLDASGKEIKSLRNRDVVDLSSYGSSFEFNSDRRYKIFDFQEKNYPYTVLFTISKTIKTSFFIPDWMVGNTTDCSVESSYLSITFPSREPVRFKEYQLPTDVKKTESGIGGEAEKHTWYVAGLPVIKKEPNSRTENYDVPNVQFSPSRFQLYGHDGAINSWTDLGSFFYKLNDGRDVLPSDKQEKVKAMVAGEKDTYAKVQKLYNYMQTSTRYVADEYGIAGWQTFEAKDVSRTGYGDCKGLVNYMKALLKTADIKAYTTLVFAGEDYHFKLDRDFPSNCFNHVILCVPQPKDTIWVECTSQELPAGYLGRFTQNRDVLIATENGGVLTHTPAYGNGNNYINRTATLSLTQENLSSPMVNIKTLYCGPMQDQMNHIVKTQTEKEIQKVINSRFRFPAYAVKNYKYSSETTNDHIPELSEQLELETQGIITGTQKRTFINLAWMPNPMKDLFQAESRTAPFVLNESFAVTDSIIIETPEGIQLESIPSDKTVSQPFCEYFLHFEKKEKSIIVTRKFIQKEGVYNADLYADYQALYKNIQSEKDKLQIVILNKAS